MVAAGVVIQYTAVTPCTNVIVKYRLFGGVLTELRINRGCGRSTTKEKNDASHQTDGKFLCSVGFKLVSLLLNVTVRVLRIWKGTQTKDTYKLKQKIKSFFFLII